MNQDQIQKEQKEALKTSAPVLPGAKWYVIHIPCIHRKYQCIWLTFPSSKRRLSSGGSGI